MCVPACACMCVCVCVCACMFVCGCLKVNRMNFKCDTFCVKQFYISLPRIMPVLVLVSFKDMELTWLNVDFAQSSMSHSVYMQFSVEWLEGGVWQGDVGRGWGIKDSGRRAVCVCVCVCVCVVYLYLCVCV